MIRFANVTKQYKNGSVALRNVSFNLETSQLVFLTGHSGAGKSTFIKLLTLEERPSHGHVFVNGKNLSLVKKRHIPYYRRSIGVVHQDHKLLYDRTVQDNVALPLIIQNLPRTKIRTRTKVALKMVGLEGCEKVNPINLSGGEQQRIGIARAIVASPRIILADEPTGNLDEKLGNEIMKIFMQLVQYETTIVVATHNRQFFVEKNYSVLELQKGVLVPAQGCTA